MTRARRSKARSATFWSTPRVLIQQAIVHAAAIQDRDGGVWLIGSTSNSRQFCALRRPIGGRHGEDHERPDLGHSPVSLLTVFPYVTERTRCWSTDWRSRSVTPPLRPHTATASFPTCRSAGRRTTPALIKSRYQCVPSTYSEPRGNTQW